MIRINVRIADCKNDSIVDGPGLRMAIYMQGCPHNCPGCHNPQTHAPQGGKAVSIDSLINRARANPLLDGITITGGEPFAQPDALKELVERFCKFLPIMVYTGYLWEDLLDNPQYRGILEHCQYLVDGPYLEAEHSHNLAFRGSANQRIIDVQKSLKTGAVIRINDFD
ncbi:MAG: anaerobic ribonucleoside-triphosphate reductase activating protein [Defluviitaleaceae bacterium]|nr:anaerobic ribonucleoside-triphosphate reductase activating protein [Defluviitaleaceae bacterium]